MTVISLSATILVLAVSFAISILAGRFAPQLVVDALTIFWGYRMLRAWFNRQNGLALRLGFGISLIALMWSIHLKIL